MTFSKHTDTHTHLSISCSSLLCYAREESVYEFMRTLKSPQAHGGGAARIRSTSDAVTTRNESKVIKMNEGSPSSHPHL